MSLITSNVVNYGEELVVDASINKVFNAIRFQESFIKCSSWPSETGSTCKVKNTDVQIRAQTVFFNKSKRFRDQEIVDTVDNKKVSFTTVDSGSLKHIPYLNFYLEPLSENKTKVLMKFKNPFHLPAKVLNIVKWVRSIHLKNLAGLKKFVEV